MKRVAVAASVAAEPQMVWNLYADVEGSVAWVPFMNEVVYISGPPGLGQVHGERTRLGGISGVSQWQIVAWDPPRRQVQLSGDFGVEIESRLPGPFGWPHERIVAKVARRGISQAVGAAKRRLEAAL